MGMAPQTKSKESKITLINTSKKKRHKKKVKEPVSRLCLFSKDNYSKLISDVPKYKIITNSVLADRMSINGSLARKAIRELLRQNLICEVSKHHRLSLYTKLKVDSTVVG